MIVTNEQREIEILSIRELPWGHGMYKITVVCEYEGELKKYNFRTTDMPRIDEARELNGERKEKVLYKIVEHEFSKIVYEWLEEVNEKKRES